MEVKISTLHISRHSLAHGKRLTCTNKEKTELKIKIRQENRMNNRILFISLFGLFIILNLVPTYLWLWGMSFIDLEKPEFSNISVNIRDNLNSALRFIIFFGLWLPILLVILKRKWKIKTLAVPTLISLILFLIIFKSQDVYPDEESEFTEKGYQHRIEKWNQQNQVKIKHWKSRDSFKSYITQRHIEWELIKEEIKN